MALSKARAKRLAHRLLANQIDNVEISLSIIRPMHRDLSEEDFDLLCNETFKLVFDHEKQAGREPERLVDFWPRD